MQKNSINEFVSIVLHCHIQMSKENRAPHLQRAQKYFSFFLCMLTLPQILESPLMLKSSHSSSAVSTLGECYTRVPPRDVLSGTLGTIDAKMGEGWSLGCSWFRISLSSLFSFCCLPPWRTDSSLEYHRSYCWEIHSQDSSIAGRPNPRNETCFILLIWTSKDSYFFRTICKLAQPEQHFFLLLLLLFFFFCFSLNKSNQTNKQLQNQNLPGNAGDLGSILGLGRYPGGGNNNPLQYSCQDNLMAEESGRPQLMVSKRIRHDWRV